MNNIIRLTESQLHNVIRRCINEALLFDKEEDIMQTVNDTSNTFENPSLYKGSATPEPSGSFRSGSHSKMDIVNQPSQSLFNQINLGFNIEEIGLENENWIAYKKRLISLLSSSKYEKTRNTVRKIPVDIKKTDGSVIKGTRTCPFNTFGDMEQGSMMSNTDFLNITANKVSGAVFRLHKQNPNIPKQPKWRIIYKQSDKKQFFYEFSYNGIWFVATPNAPIDNIKSPLD